MRLLRYADEVNMSKHIKVIYADGVTDDAEAMEAWANGETVYWNEGGEPVSRGIMDFAGRKVYLSRPIPAPVLKPGENKRVIANGHFVTPPPAIQHTISK